MIEGDVLNYVDGQRAAVAGAAAILLGTRVGAFPARYNALQVTRARRITLNTVTLLSLLLCLAVVALWWRSVRIGDTLTFITKTGDGYTLGTVPHGAAIGWTEALQELTTDYDPRRPGWSIASHEWGGTRTITLPDSGFTDGNMFLHGRFISITYVRPPFRHRSLGFDFRRDTIPRFSAARRIAGYLNYDALKAQPLSRTWGLVLPNWFLLTAFAALPAFRFARAVRRKRRRGESLCLHCGYDLRATPERCPECGRAATSAA